MIAFSTKLACMFLKFRFWASFANFKYLKKSSMISLSTKCNFLVFSCDQFIHILNIMIKTFAFSNEEIRFCYCSTCSYSMSILVINCNQMRSTISSARSSLLSFIIFDVIKNRLRNAVLHKEKHHVEDYEELKILFCCIGPFRITISFDSINVEFSRCFKDA